MNKPDTMTLTDEQRDAVIDLLVNDWIGTLYSDSASMQFYVQEWLIEGRIGYKDHSDEELVALADDAELFDEEGD